MTLRIRSPKPAPRPQQVATLVWDPPTRIAVVDVRQAPKRRRQPRKADDGLPGKILDLCAMLHIPAFRVNCGKVQTIHGSWFTGAPEGTPDVLLWIPPLGRLCGLECKRKGGRVRTAQRKWIAEQASNGVRAAVVETLAEAKALIEEWRNDG